MSIELIRYPYRHTGYPWSYEVVLSCELPLVIRANARLISNLELDSLNAVTQNGHQTAQNPRESILRVLCVGDSGELVERLRLALSVPDAVPDLRRFDDGVLRELERFQRLNLLTVDGKCGPETWHKLFKTRWVRVACDKWVSGYESTELRESAALALTCVRDELHAAGALLTSSGGKRSLGTSANATRSTASLHYVGLAHDLFVYSAMVDVLKDPYVVERESGFLLDTGKSGGAPRLWRVWARCSVGAGEQRTVRGWNHKRQCEERVTDWFIDLTELMLKHGFERIPARSGYPDVYGAAEWWHYQYERELIAGESQFGHSLVEMYEPAALAKTAPWGEQMRVWKKDWN